MLRPAKREISRFPCKERACMPESPTTPGRPSACDCALGRIAFRYTDSVGTQKQFSIAAQWLACTYPYRRFAATLADDCARLGADADRYSFIVVDSHHLLLAGLPAHLCKNAPRGPAMGEFGWSAGRSPLRVSLGARPGRWGRLEGR
jgi:hypothetical protein